MQRLFLKLRHFCNCKQLMPRWFLVGVIKIHPYGSHHMFLCCQKASRYFYLWFWQYVLILKHIFYVKCFAWNMLLHSDTTWFNMLSNAWVPKVGVETPPGVTRLRGWGRKLISRNPEIFIIRIYLIFKVFSSRKVRLYVLSLCACAQLHTMFVYFTHLQR